MNWVSADLRGRDVRKLFAPKVIEYKPPRGRPPKLPVEVLKCERAPGWYWSDCVDCGEVQAGDKFHDDWRRSGLKPVQTQQFREGECGFQASSSSTAWSVDDHDEHDGEDQEDRSPPTTDRSPNDGSVTRIYACGTLQIAFGEPKRDANVSDDAVDRIEQALAGAACEPPPTRRHPKPVPRPAGLSETAVAHLIEQFFTTGGVVRVYDERGKLLEHRDGDGRVLAAFGKRRRRRRKRPTTPGVSRGMQELADPADCTWWPVDEVAGRHRLEFRWAREMLDRDERELVEAVICQGLPTTDAAALRTALGRLSAHYRRHGYEQDVEERYALERRKAKKWLTSRGLCQ
jgi:hypothetical protein